MFVLKKIYCRVFQLGFKVALPVMPYTIPKQLDSLAQIAKELNDKKIKSVLLVVDKNVRALGLTWDFEKSMIVEGVGFEIYEQARPNPTIDDVERAREIYIKGECGAIVAIGGGSAMDCAKAVGARIARPNLPVSKMKGLLKILKKTPLLFAVPTTAGTGSEATLAAVITDDKKHHKYPINDFCLMPDYAVLDESLTLKLPPFITATTGMDALTHAVEAYIGNTTTAFTRRMSVRAVRLINESLESCVFNGENKKARKKMLKAAFYAGCSFTRSYVGYIHGVAHSLGGQYGIAHGLANAVILPVFLREYGSACEKKLAMLGRKSGVVDEKLNDRDACEAFIRWIERLNERFSIPRTIKEIKEEDIDVMAANADKESNPLYPVPRLMDKRELASVYKKLMSAQAEGKNGNKRVG